MSVDVITTGVDDLLNFLKGKDHVAMQDAATYLNVQLDTLQAWTDFLVEEKILGIEYKFTKPYIYLNKEDKPKKKVLEHTSVPIEQVRQEFVDRAQAKQIPTNKIAELWASHVRQTLNDKRTYFMEQVSRRHMDNAEHLWTRYQTDLLSRI